MFCPMKDVWSYKVYLHLLNPAQCMKGYIKLDEARVNEAVLGSCCGCGFVYTT